MTYYVTQLHGGDYYLCTTTAEEHAGIRVPQDLDHVYLTEIEAKAAYLIGNHRRNPALTDARWCAEHQDALYALASRPDLSAERRLAIMRLHAALGDVVYDAM